MSRSPFVVVGESLVDIVLPLEGDARSAVGGSPMNVAVGLARLDVPALLVTQLGEDEYGRSVVEHLQESGVALSDDAVRPDHRTSTATARLDEDHVAHYDFDLTWDLRPHDLPDDALGLHVGSLGTVLIPGRSAVLDLVAQARDTDVFVSYDPNIRPSFITDREQAWADLVTLASSSRLVKVSDEDLRTLRPGEPVERLVSELIDAEATELVVVTFASEGASAWNGPSSVHVPAPRVQVVDTVGAGDSFMAAALAVLVDWELTTQGPGALSALDEDSVQFLLEGAVGAAAVTCGRLGADPPRRTDLPATWPAG